MAPLAIPASVASVGIHPGAIALTRIPWLPFHRKLAGQIEQPGFGRGIRGEAVNRTGDGRVDRGYVDDAAGAFGLDQAAGDALREHHRRGQVGRDRGVPGRMRQGLSAAGGGDAGVVDQYIDEAEFALCASDCRIDLLVRGPVDGFAGAHGISAAVRLLAITAARGQATSAPAIAMPSRSPHQGPTSRQLRSLSGRGARIATAASPSCANSASP